MTQLCQSVIVKMHSVTGPRSGWPCTLSASTVLLGMHLCGHHDRYWRHRLARGAKIRIHPERTLPIQHGSGASNEPSAPQGAEDRVIPHGGGESRPAPLETAGGRDRPDPPAADEDLDNDEAPGPPVRYEYLAELHCLACERLVTKVTIPRPNAPVIIPERLRCSACGGRPILSGEIERRALGNPFANDPAPIRRRCSEGALP